MIGKAICLLAVMTAAIFIIPVQVAILVYRSHLRRKEMSPAKLSGVALCSKCQAEKHTH